jgi:hypothetical protein
MPAATERARETDLDAMQMQSAFARLVPGVDVDGAEEQAAHATFGPLLTVPRAGRSTCRPSRSTDGPSASSRWPGKVGTVDDHLVQAPIGMTPDRVDGLPAALRGPAAMILSCCALQGC